MNFLNAAFSKFSNCLKQRYILQVNFRFFCFNYYILHKKLVRTIWKGGWLGIGLDYEWIRIYKQKLLKISYYFIFRHTAYLRVDFGASLLITFLFSGCSYFYSLFSGSTVVWGKLTILTSITHHQPYFWSEIFFFKFSFNRIIKNVEHC